MNIKIFNSGMFALILAVICASLMLNLRQSIGVFLAKGLFDQLREETRYFSSDLLWQRVDSYGHFGEWIKEENNGAESSYSVFVKQQEVRSLWRLSIGLNNENISRVCLVANSLGINLQLFEEAKDLLRSSILILPDHPRKYRLFGELGIIYLQGEKNAVTALRYLTKSIEVLKILNPQDYTFEDLFNIRLYAFSASLIYFQSGNLTEAYRYHKIAFFESGNDDYNKAMNEIMVIRGEENIKDLQKSRYEKIKTHHQLQNRGHSETDNQDSMTLETKDDKEPGGKLLFKKALAQIKSAESQRKALQDKYVYLIPEVNSQMTLPIDRSGSRVFMLLGLVGILFLVLRKKY